MNEKRFTFDKEFMFEIYDSKTEKHYDGSVGDQEQLCDLLNEKQSEINRLQKIVDLANYQLKVQDRIIKELESENG